MISYEQRVAKMNKPGDEDKQLRLSKQYAKSLHNKAKTGKTLEDKIQLKKVAKEADNVTRRLRQNIFDLEDMLYQKSPTKNDNRAIERSGSCYPEIS